MQQKASKRKLDYRTERSLGPLKSTNTTNLEAAIVHNPSVVASTSTNHISIRGTTFCFLPPDFFFILVFLVCFTAYGQHGYRIPLVYRSLVLFGVAHVGEIAQECAVDKQNQRFHYTVQPRS